jgi:signal transduction histidine kinase
VGKIMDEMIDFFAPTAQLANIHIKAYLPGDLPAVPLDVDLFKQALLNLMLNAEQSMPEGGEITIQAMLVPCSLPAVRCEYDNQQGHCDPLAALELSLIDTGKGMPPEVLARIFEPFYSTRQGGSGLGLPTTRRIIEAHGGAIAVESAPGKGSKFTIRLPVAASPVVVAQGEAEHGCG